MIDIFMFHFEDFSVLFVKAESTRNLGAKTDKI